MPMPNLRGPIARRPKAVAPSLAGQTQMDGSDNVAAAGPAATAGAAATAAPAAPDPTTGAVAPGPISGSDRDDPGPSVVPPPVPPPASQEEWNNNRDEPGAGAVDDSSAITDSYAEQTAPRDSSRDAMDQAINELLMGEVQGAGNADTAEREALINQMLEGTVGEGIVNSRARAGRLGHASSGAQLAGEGDIRRQATMSAADQILDLRSSEDQRSRDNAHTAIGAEQGMRSAAADDDIRRMQLTALQRLLEDDAGDGPAPTAADPDGDGIDNNVVDHADNVVENDEGVMMTDPQGRHILVPTDQVRQKNGEGWTVDDAEGDQNGKDAWWDPSSWGDGTRDGNWGD